MLISEIFSGIIALIIGIVMVYFAPSLPRPIDIIVKIVGIILAAVGIILVAAGILGIGLGLGLG